MSHPALSPEALRSHLTKCGYTAARSLRIIGSTAHYSTCRFFDRPWDTRTFAGHRRNGVGRLRGREELHRTWRRPHSSVTAITCSGGACLADGPTDHRDILPPDVEASSASTGGSFGRSDLCRQDEATDQDSASNVVRRRGADAGGRARLGATLHHLVETAIQELAESLGGRLRTKKNFADLYKTVFWLLAAKLS